VEKVGPTPNPQGLKILGEFLRAKRYRTPPAERGIQTSSRRRLPGLSREEIASLADIGTSWYARLEAGHIPQPTLGTMRAVSQALRLNETETAFAFELAGIYTSEAGGVSQPRGANPIAEMLSGTGLVSMSLWDRFWGTIAWNAIADAMFQLSQFQDRVQRNPLVRIETEFATTFFGADYESWARNIVGTFRRAYSTGELTPYAEQVFQLASKLETFRKYWDQHVVTDASTPHGIVITRHHPEVGTFSAVPIDLAVPEQQAFIRILSPANEDSRAKFEALKAIGQDFSSGES
jgi:transcriptional regulator with XRE-family HTH domain